MCRMWLIQKPRPNRKSRTRTSQKTLCGLGLSIWDFLQGKGRSKNLRGFGYSECGDSKNQDRARRHAESIATGGHRNPVKPKNVRSFGLAVRVDRKDKAQPKNTSQILGQPKRVIRKAVQRQGQGQPLWGLMVGFGFAVLDIPERPVGPNNKQHRGRSLSGFARKTKAHPKNIRSFGGAKCRSLRKARPIQKASMVVVAKKNSSVGLPVGLPRTGQCHQTTQRISKRQRRIQGGYPNQVKPTLQFPHINI